jgi:hypothetical protein
VYCKRKQLSLLVYAHDVIAIIALIKCRLGMCLGQTVAVCLQAGYLLRRLDWQHAAVRNMQLLAPLSDETQSFAKTGSHTYGALIHGALSTGRGAKTRSGVRQVAAVRMTQAMHRAAAKRSNKTAVSVRDIIHIIVITKKSSNAHLLRSPGSYVRSSACAAGCCSQLRQVTLLLLLEMQ